MRPIPIEAYNGSQAGQPPDSFRFRSFRKVKIPNATAMTKEIRVSMRQP